MTMILCKILFFQLFIILVVVVKASSSNPNRIFSSSKQFRSHRSHHPKLTAPHRSLQSSSSSSSSSFSTSVGKLTARDGGQYDFFGNSDAVSISNNRIIVGAYKESIGAAYLFGDPNDPQSGRDYSQLAILTAGDEEESDLFGDSVDIDGGIIVVGATYAAMGGAVYVFQVLDGSTISQVAKLTASNGMDADSFGDSVAIHGKYILVGASGADNFAGSAYLFGNPSNDPNNPEWMQLQQIQPNDLTEGFGISVAMDDNIAVVGASGANAAYVFAPVSIDENVDSSSSLSTSWTQMAKLTRSTGGFGLSVAVAANWIVVGAPYDDSPNGSDAGAVLVFTKMSSSSSSPWTQMSRLLAADGATGNYFGTSVSISKDTSTIVVGADSVDFSTNITDSGAAYLFRITNSTTTSTSTTAFWTQVGKFVAADGDTLDLLGTSITIENNIVVVGARGDDSFTGSVYVVETGFSLPPSTIPTEMTTAAPTGEPTAKATPEPTLSPTPKPSISPTTMVPSLDNGKNDNSSPPSLAPTINPNSSTVPISPTTIQPIPNTNPPANNNNFTVQPAPAEQSTGDSGSPLTPGAFVGVSAIVVVGMVAVSIAFFNFRLKREAREQQQHQQQNIHTRDDPFLPPPPTSPAAVETETPIMADVVIEPNSIRTLEADAFLDPTATTSTANNNGVPIPADANAAAVAQKELVTYKDQVRPFEPPGQASNNMPPSSL